MAIVGFSGITVSQSYFRSAENTLVTNSHNRPQAAERYEQPKNQSAKNENNKKPAFTNPSCNYFYFLFNLFPKYKN